MKKSIIFAITALGLMLCLNSQSMATEENKNASYQQLFSVTGAEPQYNQMLARIAASFGAMFQKQLEVEAENSEALAPELQEQFDLQAAEAVKGFTPSLQAKMGQEMPFSTLMENVLIPTYDAHFTVEEIEAVTAFYQSEVGKKFVNLAPQLMQETMVKMSTQYQQKISEIGQAFIAEELARLNALKQPKS